MKVAALAALSLLTVLLVLPVQAGQRHRLSVLPAATCDNDGHCTTPSVPFTPVANNQTSRRKVHAVKAPVAAPAETNTEGAVTTEAAPTAAKVATAPAPVARARDANGNNIMVTVQTAYGCNITVHPAYASKFLKFYALLKEHGYKVDARINKCFAHGGHVSGSNHYIGAACDNQYGWNRAPAYMYHVGDLIRQAGLYDGCRFGDCGHVEAVPGTHNRPPNLYAAVERFKSEQSTTNYQP